MRKEKRYFENLRKQLIDFRFNLFLHLHLKATANKAYKWWHERKFATPLHVSFLAIYLLGILTGVFFSLPRDTTAVYSVPQEPLIFTEAQNIYSYDLTSQTETKVTPNRYNQYTSSISGSKVVWGDERNSNVDIYMYDFATQTETAITTNGGYQYNPIISGDKIVWQDDRNGSADIYMYNLTTQTEAAVITEPSNQYSPYISGDKIVWQDDRNGGWDIYMYDLATLTESPIVTDSNTQQSPRINGSRIVWTDYRNNNWDIYMYDLATSTESQITSDVSDEQMVSISGDKIIWEDYRNGNAEIYMYDIGTSSESRITNDPNAQQNPAIDGNKIIWEDYRNGNAEIYMYDIGTSSESRITTNGFNQASPAISGSRIVWTDYRDNFSGSSPKTYGEWTAYLDSNLQSIFAVNNITKQKIRASSPSCTNLTSAPAIFESKIVWSDSRNGNSDIYMYDLNTSVETKITSDLSEHYSPVIYGGKIIWHDNRNGNWDIYMYDLITSLESQITTNVSDQYNAVIYANNIVWEDYRNGNADIYSYYLDTSVESRLTTSDAEQSSPDIYGDKVVWQDSSSGTYDVYLHNISTSVTTQITTDPLNQANPAIYDNKIVWQDERNGAYDVYFYNIDTSTEFRITTNDSDQYNPAIYGANIVWEDNRNGFSQIFIGVIDETSPTFLAIPGSNQTINIANNQIIRISPLVVKTKPQDSESGLLKVEYYFDQILVATDSAPDADGVFESSLDLNLATNKEGGVTLKAKAYDNAGNTSENTVNIIPDPYIYPYIQSTINIDGHSILEENITNYGDLVLSNTHAFYVDDYINPGKNELWSYNLLTSQKKRLITSADPIYDPSANDTYIYYFSTGGIYRYNYQNDSGPELIAEQPPVGGIAFEQWSAVSSNYFAYTSNYGGDNQNISLYRHNLSLLKMIPLQNSGYTMGRYAISNNYITWAEASTDDIKIYFYNIQTEEIKFISTHTKISSPSFFMIDDNKFVWDENRVGNHDIYMYDFASGVGTRITSSSDDEEQPSINNNRIVYKYRDGSMNYKMFIYYINTGVTKQLFYDSRITRICHPYLRGNYVLHEASTENNGVELGPHTGLFKFEYVDIFAPESITLSPTVGTTGDALIFTVTASDNAAPTRAEISIAGGAYTQMNGASSPFTTSTAMPQQLSASYVVRVYDAAGNLGIKTGTISLVDNDKPEIIETGPSEGTTGDPAVITAKVTDNIAVSAVYISFNGTNYEQMNFVGGQYTYEKVLPSNTISPFKYYIKARDGSGNEVISSEKSITVKDNDPPEIVSVTEKEKITRSNNQVTVVATDNIKPVRATITFDGVVWKEMEGTESPFTYKIDVSQMKEGEELKFYVRVYDEAGNYASTEPQKTRFVVGEEKKVEPPTSGSIGARLGKAFSKILTDPGESLALVAGVAVDIIKLTPPPVAYTFPYLLFIVLAIFAWRLSIQARDEILQAARMMDIIKVEKIIAEDKENFIALASHYLRTPMTILNGEYDLNKSQIPNGISTELKKVIESLDKKIAAILAAVEGNKYLSMIEKPVLVEESIKAYGSLFIWLPVLLVAAVAVFANYLFERVAHINISVINYIIEGIVFLIVAQFFVTVFRKKKNEKANIENLTKTEEYEKKVDEARNQFIESTFNALSDDVTIISGIISTPTLSRLKAGFNEGVVRFNGVLARLTTLAEVKAGKKVAEKDIVIAKDLVESIVAKNNKEIAKKKLTIEVAGSIGTIHQNKKMLYTLIDTAIDNAVKFSNESGKVKIEMSACNGIAKFVVSDNGIGISKEGMLHLFKPFTRATSVLRFDYEGFGFNLFLAKIIAEYLGGDVQVKSVKGRGTTVFITVEM